MGMTTPMTWSGRPKFWLIATGIFELVLGLGFIVTGYFVETVRGAFYLTGGILALVAVGLIAWGRKMAKGYANAQRIRTMGVAGTAQIVGINQTGISMNDQPLIELDLNVTTEHQGPYRVTVKDYIPLIMMGRLSNGQPLPVKVDPADPSAVIIEWESAGFGGPVPPAFGQNTGESPADAKARLLRDGVAGTATIMSATPTGQTDGEGRPVYALQLQIAVAGQNMEGPAQAGVPPERVAEMTAGNVLPIKADPMNPSHMAVDWDNA